MAEETQGSTPQEQATVTQPVTDADLSSAWENAQTAQPQDSQPQEQTTEQQTQTETEPQTQTETETATEAEEPDEPIDHKERSRLGRRLAKMEEHYGKIEQLLERFAQPQQPQQSQPQPLAPTAPVAYGDSYLQQQLDAAKQNGIIPDFVTTPEDHIKIDAFVRQVRGQMEQQYSNAYLQEVANIKTQSAVPDELHAEIVKELTGATPFNVKHYDDPLIDSRINYANAKAAVLERRLTAASTKFKGQHSALPTGVTTSDRVQSAAVPKIPKFTEAEADFIKRTNMSEASIERAFKEELPFHLRGMRQG
jgi:DNA mismatch repair ATPase MutL